MSELKQTIRADLKTAMKAKEKQRTSAIRALLAAIQAEETNGSGMSWRTPISSR